jgi:hypothetical protein
MDMRRTVVLSASAALAVLLVGVAMLLWTQQAQAQEPCNFNFCLDKTATPTTVEEDGQITFTITERCVAPTGCFDSATLIDQLPAGLTVDSVAPAGTCSTSGNTVTCGPRSSSPTAPFTLTIVATTTECGSFTNRASHGGGTPATAQATVTVSCAKPPRVNSTFPTGGATGVPPSAIIRANFSEDMNASTINGQTFKLFKKGSTTKVGASVTYNPTLDRAVLHPNNFLQRGVSYRAVVTTGAKDKAGHRLDQNRRLSGLQQKVWFFKVSD